MMLAVHPPNVPGQHGGGESSMLGNLMGGVLSAASNDAGAGKTGQALVSSGVKLATQPRAYLPAPSLTPHAPGPSFNTPSQDDPFSSAPTHQRPMTNEDAEAWARANPAAAEALGRRLFAEKMRGG